MKKVNGGKNDYQVLKYKLLSQVKSERKIATASEGCLAMTKEGKEKLDSRRSLPSRRRGRE
jgi:hypothetical protein